MSDQRRNFKRLLGERRYKKMFVISTEGTETEPQYFNMFNTANAVIHVQCLKGKHASSPPQVLKRMVKFIKSKGLRSTDEAWLVVDTDQWTGQQLAALHQWSQSKDNYGFAVSNPKFELWLLLHFEEGNGITSPRQCTERLTRHLPNFAKRNVEVEKLTGGIANAIQRAKKKDTPRCAYRPRTTGTTVYRLVERLTTVNNQQ
jgi:hypothetical protein